MSTKADKPKLDEIGDRRTFGGRRRLSLGRRMYYFFGLPLALGLLRLLWWSYRVEKLIGEDVIDRMVSNDKVYAPVYWHQHTLLCLMLMRRLLKRGFRAGFIITPSVDGEVPAKVARRWGAVAIRGSAAKTGALALRDMHAVMQHGVSVVTAADGPLGPKAHFKLGVVLMARIGGAPMIPIACAADRAWYLDRWDDFLIPKPFSRIVLAVGEPYEIPRGGSMEELEKHRQHMENAVNSLIEQSKQALIGR
ncbi:MAG: DUF374 domain-containing protein [Gammaproteobacteria bacterium]|nr:DUF374 domain-containing protein [Gammaproteobacteria bacterium]